MFSGLLNIMYADFPGSSRDLHFMDETAWLQDSAVNTLVFPKKGQWYIFLVMAHFNNPYRFLCRYINACHSEQKAAIYAEAYVRTAQKDRRGSLKIQYEDFNICPN